MAVGPGSAGSLFLFSEVHTVRYPFQTPHLHEYGRRRTASTLVQGQNRSALPSQLSSHAIDDERPLG